MSGCVARTPFIPFCCTHQGALERTLAFQDAPIPFETPLRFLESLFYFLGSLCYVLERMGATSALVRSIAQFCFPQRSCAFRSTLLRPRSHCYFLKRITTFQNVLLLP